MVNVEAHLTGHVPQDQPEASKPYRYVEEFDGKHAGKHNVRELDTIFQMRETVSRLVGHRVLMRGLIADNGLFSTARSG
ncbi:hypothetical protein F4X33_05105 [Candidatus Poribacteria bacterium]|nr:hypothetical protein [Candidatus Poribacteria bacterium]